MSNNSFAGINFNDPNSESIFRKHNDEMDPKWSHIIEKSFDTCDVSIIKSNDNNVYVVNGVLKGDMKMLSYTEKIFIKYWAANSPTYNSSFSGSGLPYPNKMVAFENTENIGVAKVMNGKFSFSLRYPNSYYKELGTIYVPPQVKIKFCNDKNIKVSKVQEINLGEGIPFRTLTWPNQRNWNNGPMFYCNNNLPARTQYQILVDSAYPSKNKIPENFWGTMPPH